MFYFTGDINLTDWYFNLGFGIGTKISSGLDPFKYLDRKPDDIWIGNFEGVASSVSCNNGIHSEVFRVNPTVIEKISHFDAYGFANNHAMQHGAEAYIQTVDTLTKCGSVVFGSNSKKSCLLNYKGRNISVTGLSLRIDEFSSKPSYWYNPEYSDINKELESLPTDSFKIIYVHWGNEYINRPSSQQKKFAHWLIDSGFDLVIGMHPHVLQGYEDYKGKRIYYSLGNFVFEMASEPCKIGAIVALDFLNSRPIINTKYIRIDDDSCPHLVNESSIPEKWRFSYLNECLMCDDNSEEYHHEIERGYAKYRKENHKYILNNIVHHPISGMNIILDFIRRRL